MDNIAEMVRKSLKFKNKRNYGTILELQISHCNYVLQNRWPSLREQLFYIKILTLLSLH